MTAMVQEFDGVRELSMEEIEAVAGGPAPVIAFVAIGLASVAVAGVTYVAGRANGHQANSETCSGEGQASE